ncbi:hypothetical protein D3C71_1417830 [compost metagenome]
MRLAAKGHRAAFLHGLELGQAFGGGGEDAFVGTERAGLLAEFGVGDGHIGHVALLEGAVVGQGLLVLVVAVQLERMLLFGADAIARRHVLAGLQHGVLGIRVVAHVVGHPVLGNAVAAGAAGVGVVHHRPVGLAVGHHQQRAGGRAAGHLLCSHLQRAHTGGAGLLHRGPGHTVDTHHAGDPGQAVEAALLGIGDAEDRKVHRGQVVAPRGERLLAYGGGQRQRVEVGQRALPLGKRGRPVDTVGDEGVHDRVLAWIAHQF